MNILSQIRSRFAGVLSEFCDDPAEYLAMIRPAQDAKFGDFQANMAMPLAKRQGNSPREVAAAIVAKLDVAEMCAEPQVAGPGFINLTLRDDWLETQVNALVGNDRLGVPVVERPRTIVIDFSAPNVAKPMHVGHLRSTVIGAALRSVLKFLGHTVIGDNHIGDWGTQFGMIIYGYKHFRDDDAFRENAVQELARLYRLVNQISDYHAVKTTLPKNEDRLAQLQHELNEAEANADPRDKKARKSLGKQRNAIAALKDEIESQKQKLADVESDATLQPLAVSHADIADAARRETAKLHSGDKENTELWKRFLPECLKLLQSMYDRLGIEFDESLGESFYQPMLADVVADLREKGLAEESQGAQCIFNEGFHAPLLVQKSDGAFTYATTDLATIRYRVEHLHADAALYVVDNRQSEHFEQLFATAARWGYDIDLRHIKFGTIMGPDKKPYKTRSGDTVGLESLLDEAVGRAREIVDANDDAKTDAEDNPAPELNAAERSDIAEAVGLGAIKYVDLHHNRESDYVFSWDKMLAMTGDTAPYMQYAYARVNGIFRRGNVDRNALPSSGGRIRFDQPAERALALQLCRFADAVYDVADDYRPNLLTQYLFELANRFATFFEKCPVLKAETEELRTSRFLLCDLTARVIAKGLGLLGIRTCEQM
ncbi:MAG: arginine--tRNA ligase [Planctomycetaceae bacterium]